MGFPANIADIIAQIRDGEVGLIETVKIGTLVVDCLTGLNAPRRKNVTRKPIDAGFAVTDAAADEPDDLVLNIVLTNPDYSIDAGVTAALSGNIDQLNETWRDKRNQLYQIFDDIEINTIQTHDRTHPNMVIDSIDPVYDSEENWDAFVATVTAVQITKVTAQTTTGKVNAAQADFGEL
jgi:hypothetical protein